MSKNILCDIVVLPSPGLQSDAIAKSRELSERGSYFSLGKEICVPHVSLYMLQIAFSDLPEAEGILSRIAKTTSPLQLDACRSYSNNGYVDVEYERYASLDRLQMDVVHGLNPMRNGMYIDEIKRMKAAEGVKLENLQHYGYQNIGELFRPHITFTRLMSELDFRLEDVTKFSGVFPKLGIFELGDNGTCAKAIKTFDLSA